MPYLLVYSWNTIHSQYSGHLHLRPGGMMDWVWSSQCQLHPHPYVDVIYLGTWKWTIYNFHPTKKVGDSWSSFNFNFSFGFVYLVHLPLHARNSRYISSTYPTVQLKLPSHLSLYYTMPKTLERARKAITKKKGAITALHEFSRDSKRLHRASMRDEKLEKISAARRKKDKPYSMLLRCLSCA